MRKRGCNVVVGVANEMISAVNAKLECSKRSENSGGERTVFLYVLKATSCDPQGREEPGCSFSFNSAHAASHRPP